MITRKMKSLPLAVAMTCTILSGQASALEEVIVTAQFRAESLQDTPIAMSAFNEDAIESMALINVRDIGLASPSLQTPAFPFSNNNLALFIRGIGNADSIVLTKDHTVGLYYDGVYAARSSGLLSDLADLERVEILRGPQGTLYGRNTTAGAINFISRKPTGEFGFEQSLSMGEYEYLRAVTHLDLPEAAGFKVRLTAAFNERDGWVENEGANAIPGYKYNDYYKEESDGYRFALRYDGLDNLLVDYSYDYSDMDTTPGYFQYGGPTGGLNLAFMPITNSFPDRLENTRSPIGGEKTAYYLPLSNTEVQGHNLTIAWDINENMTLKSITGYREFDDDASQNFSESFGGAGTLEIHTVTEHDQFSQEFQLLGNLDRINYVAGLYYFEEDGDQAESQFLDRGLVDEEGIRAIDLITGAPCLTPPFPACTDFAAVFPAYLGQYTVSPEVESFAAFGQLTYELTEAIELTGGLRYTDDDREAVRTNDGWPFVAFAPGESASDKDKVDYTLIADFAISDAASVYVKTATGFRSGGSSRNGIDFNQTFDLEEVTSYEIGWKTEVSDWARINGAVFYMEVDDIILDYLPDPVNNPAAVEVFNSGDAEIYGLELDTTFAVTDQFFVTLGYTYLDYDINDAIFPDGSNRTDTTELQWAPEHAVAVAADYTVPLDIGELLFHLDYSWQDDQYALANTEFGEIIVGDYGLLNARISLAEVEIAGGAWQFAAWARNLTDEDSSNYLIGGTANTFLAPRMYGGEIKFRY